MKQLQVPSSITRAEVFTRGLSWSPSMYRRVEIPNRNTRQMSDLLSDWCNGYEVGSLAYVQSSPYRFIRTKAIQAGNALSQFKGDSVGYITPWAYYNAVEREPRRAVKDGDIIYARGGNVGEVAIAEGCGQAIPSGHMLRLVLSEKKWYVFAFMKHDICKLQQRSHQTGSIKALDNFKIDYLLSCRVPFPDQADAERVERFVSVLMEAIVNKERAIRHRHETILRLTDEELGQSKHRAEFGYRHPSLSEVTATMRFDTGLYCRGFREFKYRVDSYRYGATTLSKMGVRSRRGPNLAVTVIGRSLYSDVYKPGWYELIRPVNIGEYGTLEHREWLGNHRKLPVNSRGDLILGCEGFEKGRSIVLIDEPTRTTTNFHGTVISWPGADIRQIVWLRCFLSLLRDRGVIDWVGVGGSGGHMSPEYFDYLPIPRFPDESQERIAKLYHSPVQGAPAPPGLDRFVAYHQARNAELGIWELDREIKNLQAQLAEVQESIIQGKTVKVPLPD